MIYREGVIITVGSGGIDTKRTDIVIENRWHSNGGAYGVMGSVIGRCVGVL